MPILLTGAEPIVGQPFKIMLAYSTAIIECQCEAKCLLMLPGLNTAVQCPACRHAYAIAKTGEIAVGQIRADRIGAA